MTQVCDDIPFADILGKVLCEETLASSISHATLEPFFYCK